MTSGAPSNAEVKNGPGHQRLAGLFGDHGHVEKAAALTAVLFRNQQRGPS